MQSKSRLQLLWEKLLRQSSSPQAKRVSTEAVPRHDDKPTLPIPSAPKFRWDWERIGGPHSYLFLNFEDAAAAAMHERAAPLLETYFELRDKNENHQRWMTFDSSEWNYLQIELSATRLDITDGWGGHGDVSIGFLEQLLGDGSIALERWRVETGGEGYGHHHIEVGMGLEEFANYCVGQTRESTIEEIDAQLDLLLAAHGWSEKYGRGPRVDKGNGPVFPLLYDVPRTAGDTGWDVTRHQQDFWILADELCQRCHVRTRGTATWPFSMGAEPYVGGAILVHSRV